MKISSLLKEKEVTVSLEIFPPKHSGLLENAKATVAETAKLCPTFISCTYGATGGTSEYTAVISEEIEKNGITALSHLTCVSSTREKVNDVISVLKEKRISNILALRGDIPKEEDFTAPGDYKYAFELIKEIKQKGDFCIGGACYPEGHPESESMDSDIEHLKEKVDTGAEFLTTQMFFDNHVMYDFIEKARRKNINVPILAGIMPVTDASRIGKMIELSKSRVPSSLAAVISKYGGTPDMKKAGIEFSAGQIRELIDNGIGHIHIYTMNKPDIAKEIMIEAGLIK